MSARLHILNSHGRLDQLQQRIEAGFARAIAIIELRLPPNSVDVVVRNNPAATIPDLGLCGYCPSADLVFINLDAEHPFLNENFETEFMAMLGHEMHHAARWSGPGYGSMLEALVSEGLACCFETDLRCGDIPHYAKPLSTEQMLQIQTKAMPILDSKAYDHSVWFFGTGALPQHAGYSLGFELASRYIRTLGADAASLAHEPATNFLPLLTARQ